MSFANGKTEKGASAKAATGASTAVAVVSATPTAQAAQDKNHGRGGLYTVVNGVRQRAGGTAQTTVKKD